MPTPQQENFRAMIDNVLEEYPRLEYGWIKRRLNDNLRSIVARRPWSGLVKRAVISIPAQYTTGTVTVTLDTKVVTGTSTAWPVSDKVNTTVSTATNETGIIDMTPAAMIGIEPGVWLLINGGGSTEEAVFVVSTDTAAGTFRAKFTKTHAAAETIQRSSLAGLQFRVSDNDPFYTVVGVSSATRLLLDKAYARATASGKNYVIVAVYVSLGRDLNYILSIANTSREWSLLHGAQYSTAWLDWYDPRRQTIQSSYMIVFHETDLGGAPLWELYPRPTSQQNFPYYYVAHWPALESDNDLLPNGIRSDVLVKRAKAEAARWPGHKRIDGGIYYDPGVSRDLANEAERDILFMMLEDDNTNTMTAWHDFRKKYPPYLGDEWNQSHDYGLWAG